jgi:uncharacterized damage-inducible protein DinB
MNLPEPWLRGPVDGVHPVIGAVLHSFQQAREDLAKHTEGLALEQIWATPHGFGSVGFHLRHIAGSTGRLTTYLTGDDLSDQQFAALRSEHDPGASREELLAGIDREFENTERILRTIHSPSFTEPRAVGRKQLPTTVGGLLVHIAEHTQRHVGQAIAAARLARSL